MQKSMGLELRNQPLAEVVLRIHFAQPMEFTLPGHYRVAEALAPVAPRVQWFSGGSSLALIQIAAGPQSGILVSGR